MDEQNQNNSNEKHYLDLTINDVHYKWHHEYITGSEIRHIGKIPAEDEIFLAIKRPWQDEPIKDDTRVNLARPEIEHFYSKEKGFKVTLIVNGRQKEWSEKTITFEQAVILAFGSYDPNPTRIYTVTYDRGPHRNPAGSMVKGDRVFVKDKMIFNVTATNKS